MRVINHNWSATKQRPHPQSVLLTLLTLCGLALRLTRMTSLGFSGLVHEETHPCGSNFIQSVFKTVQTRCNDSVLIQIVPFVNNMI